MSKPEELAALNPLEDLYTEATLAAAAKKTKRIADPGSKHALAASAKTMHELFASAENWERTRGVAVIDRQSNTLLGNYSEYIHKSVKNCRRLVRETTPISVSDTEYVSGYLGDQIQMIRAAEPWEQSKIVRADVILTTGVACPSVVLEVRLRFGGILKAELCNDTQFSSDDGGLVLTIPASTNVLECMTLDSKLAMRAELED